MTWSIRPATPGDVAALTDIERQSFSDRAWTPSEFLKCECFVAETEAGQVAGFLVWHDVFSDAYGKREREILNLAVDPAYRRLGIARSLLKDALQTPALYFLEVRESNVAAQKLYESLGFVEAGRRPHYYRLPDETAIVMRMEQC